MKRSVSHKVFISYHHCPSDDFYRNRLEEILGDSVIDKSVHLGDLNPLMKTETLRKRIRDEFLRDSSVTIVLVGTDTWKRKHVDWEISSSIRDAPLNRRSGLIGIVLPTVPFTSDEFLENPEAFKHVVPPRLFDNVVAGFARIYPWTENKRQLKRWIHGAFKDGRKVEPANSRRMFLKNRWGKRWYR